MAEDTHRLEVPVRPDRREAVAAALWALGADGLWEQPGRTVAWFTTAPAAGDLAAQGASIPELAADDVTLTTEPDHDWQAAWKATISPIHAGRTTVVPSWLAAAHQPEPGSLTLVLDPGRAFGTGHHATTALCLELLDDLDTAGLLRERTVADIGCGSGILAIAAAARGARVQAIDIDPDAVAVTRENAATNQVALTTAVGSTEVVDGPVDVVVANLISDVVRDHAAQLVGLARRELLVSGITTERRDDVLDALTAAGATVVEVRERDGWIAARLRPQAAPPRRAGATTSLLALLALAGATLLGCTTPQVETPAEEAEDSQAAEADTEPDPQTQALAAEVTSVVELVEEIRDALTTAATAASLDEVQAGLARADALLVTDPDDGGLALLPIEPAERTEARRATDAFTLLLTQAREAGGSLGRSVVEALRDPVAGDLGAWELDAPGVVTGARRAGTEPADADAARERILELDGEATKAIAWVARGLQSTDLDQARTAAEQAEGHLEVVTLVLRDLAANVEADTQDGTEELGPVLEDAEDPGDAVDPEDAEEPG